MAKDGDASFNDKSCTLDDSNSNKSFVKKVKSRVSGFLPSSLTKWFGGTESQVRYREESEDEDEETFQIQPPAKRIKPNDTITSVSFQLNSASTPKYNAIDVPPNKTHINSANHVENKLTFPEPIAGPSGYKPAGKSLLNKQLYSVQNDVTNGDKYSDSGESVTSGYSSMLVGGKDVVVDSKTDIGNDSTGDNTKFTYGINSRVNDRSLFGDRYATSPPHSNPSMSSRQPSFNSSVFGSPNFVDRTLASKKILNSPFYSGRTTYGGASAYGRTWASLSSDKSAIRNSVQIKPVNDITRNDVKSNSTLSKTARRILDTLEQYTTPISDAKKIPNPTNPNRKKYSSINPYSVREKVGSNRELQVPTVPDLLKMKLKERLQDSTESVRQLANSSKSVLNREEYKIRTLEDEETSAKHTNKIKNKISSVRHKNEPHRTVEEVKLPDIQLPITILPKFDFSLPPKESSPLSAARKSAETVKTSTTVEKIEKIEKKRSRVETKTVEISQIKGSNKVQTSKFVAEFKFSNPLIIAENLKSIRAINNFKFSEPTPTNKSNIPQPQGQDTNKASPPTKNNGDNFSKDATKSDPTDLFAKFKPSSDTWECGVCLIRNVNTKAKCAACETPRPSQDGAAKQQTVTGGFGDKFKRVEGQWECKVCLVVNPTDKNKCVACENPKQDPAKPDTNIAKSLIDMWECKVCLVRNKITDLKCIACTNPKPVSNGPLIKTEPVIVQGFGGKFVPPPDTWECPTCSIRNKTDIPKCLACQTARPAHIKAGFGDAFKKKDDEWECDTCMVKNSKIKDRCQCCDALRIGPPDPDMPKTTKTISLFNYGLDTTQRLTTTGFTFGIKQPEAKSTTSAAGTSFTPIFGQSAAATNTSSTITISTTPTPTFTFGIKPPTTPHPTQEKNETKSPPVADVTADNKRKSEDTTGNVKILSNQTIHPPEISNLNETKKDEPTTLNGETKTTPAIFGITPTLSTPNKATESTISKPIFAFGANTSTPPVSTTISTIFTPPNANASFKFTPSEPPKPSAFGTAPPASTFVASPPAQNLFNNSNQTSSNLFAAPSTVETATPAKPVFGSDNAVRDGEPPGKVPVFSFGQVNKPETDQSKLGFGAVQPSSAAPSGGFNFGQVAAQPNLNFSAGSNATPAAASVQGGLGAFDGAGSNQNGVSIFNFGGTGSATPKTGFNFGSAAAPAQPAASTTGPTAPPNAGVFNFGFSGNAPAPSSGGFNFSGSASTEFKPNFNFTSGTPALSAQPTPGDKPARVIRRAVRRAHR